MVRITKQELIDFMKWYLKHEELHDKSCSYISKAYEKDTGRYVSRETIRVNRDAGWYYVKGKLVRLS